VAEHILNDKNTINEEAPELSDNLIDPEQPRSTLLEVRNSIFAEPHESSSCSAAIKGIEEVDPMGARLLMLLSKQRTFKHDA
jgi:hypothetical protein